MNCANHPQATVSAYCRTCGKALCEDCKRDVMGAIYCEPCIAARLQSSTPPPVGVPVAQAVPSGSPNPAVATMLGMIPGVGAMYNGQFAKALIHVAILGMLIVIANHVNNIFGLAVVFFWFYMVFDAYKTAHARQLGLPDPDLLGIHRLIGIHEASPPAASVGSSVPLSGISDSTAPNPSAMNPPAGTLPPASDKAPMGAMILIGIGVIFLLNNMGLFHFGRMWPLLLIGLGLWIAYKRTAGVNSRSTR
ncbi:MAG TPA: DUF5668 domain-containing protein [Candidatus Angelobacter sp.]|jgi:hypothetical protein|nr:DUF5668 domain-containing protein [Candidatus Angelobacter sp.]